MQEIVVEFLRRGPAHNQLISPLTEYLVLCGQRPVQTLKVDFEHRELLEHLWALRYADDVPSRRGSSQSDDGAERAQNETRRLHLAKVRDLVTGIIEDIDGLEAEVSKERWVHLRLVLSPGELSLLPYELSRCPSGFPGNTLPLLLNSQRPITITREVRQSGNRVFQWPSTPRILVAATNFRASPVPLRAHLVAIRQALSPWLKPKLRALPAATQESDVELVNDVGSMLTVIEAASLEKILAACKSNHYTHVHILAHGADASASKGRGYGLALHGPDGESKDVVDGERLATALCKPDGLAQSHRPAVVVLASCDSGARADVEYTGASTAQLLHTAGIPLVIGSQYPLSKVGSTILTRELYPQLLQGRDPRVSLYHVRRRLQSDLPTTHDWASLVAYAGFPADLAEQLVGVRLNQSLAALEAGREWGRFVEPAMSPDAMEEPTRLSAQSRRSAATELTRRNEWATQWLEAEVREMGSRSEANRHQFYEACGLLGSSFKRQAEANFNAGKPWTRLLEIARDWYGKGHAPEVLAGLHMVDHWTTTQYLNLRAVLDETLVGQDRLWARARSSAEAARYSTNGVDQTWGLASLLELWLLRPLVMASPTPEAWDTSTRRVRAFAEDFANWAAGDQMASMRRQLERYVNWWGPSSSVPGGSLKRVAANAAELILLLTGGSRSEVSELASATAARA